MTNILAKCEKDNTDFKKALLRYRNTTIDPNLGSPTELLLKRKLRINIPCLNLHNDSDFENKTNLECRQSKMKMFHDRLVKN